MTKIKFGTDGWRAIIAQEFTTDNVARVTEGVATWLLKSKSLPVVVLGHDCRFGGELFVETIAKILATKNIKVYIGEGFVSTPMISYGTKMLQADLGIIITASHNPAEYNGYKLKGSYGGPLLVQGVQEIENLIPDQHTVKYQDVQLVDLQKQGIVEYKDLETIYCYHVQKNFDLEAIEKSGLNIAYNAMYGAGQKAFKRILPNMRFYHCEHNPTFYGIAPEPIMKNLGDFSDYIRAEKNIDLAIITDGDADRIGLMDGEGHFIDSHHILLLLIQYLHKYKKMNGKVCTGFSSTVKIGALCKKHNLPLEIVPIGFKYICDIMIKEDVLVGGEESGGIAIKGHIPERDGIWIGLTLLEFMAKTGKKIQELVDEIYQEVGSFAFQRIDLTLSEQKKQEIIANCKSKKYNHFGSYQVEKMDDMDGYKFYFNADEWVMIRPSGTEPVLRTYAESKDKKSAEAILKATHQAILN
jgi:phosphomannomutase